MGKLLKTTAKGVAWSTLSSIIRNIVQLLQIVILTRILEKADFGIIAIANVVLGFIRIFLDLGISVGILHKQDITKNQYSSLFWLNIILGFLLTGIIISIAPAISTIYKEPSLTPIISLLSLSILISSFGSQHRTVQQKELRFKYISIVDIVSSVVIFATAILFAQIGYGVYSLVYSTLAGAAISSLIYLTIGLLKDRNIHFHFKFNDTIPFLKIGVFQIGTSVLDFFSGEIDIMFIGSAFGKEVLGVYSLCKKLVQAVYGTINPIFTKVLTPLLSKMQSDIENIKNIYLKIVETLSIFNFPIYFLISVFSYGILFIMYGEEYTGGAFMLSILSIYYGILSTGNPVGSLQVALGRTDIGFYWTIIRIIVTLLVVYIASFFDINVLVVLLLVSSLINIVLAWRVQLLTMIKLKLKPYLLAIIKPLLISSLLSLPLYIWCYSSISIIKIILLSTLFIILYVISVNIFFKDSYIVGLSSNILKKHISSYYHSRTKLFF